MFRKPLVTLIAAGMLGATASSALAMPNADDKCVLNVKHPPNTGGIKFSEDCKQIYVLPPLTGKVSLSTLSRKPNMQFCPAVLDLQKTSSLIMTTTKTLAA